jgi:hypothetical protein
MIFLMRSKLEKVHRVEDNLYQNLIEWYKPKDYLFEKAIKFDASRFKRFSHNQRLNSQMGMWMSLKTCLGINRRIRN